MTAEKQLQELLKYVKSEMEFYETLLIEDDKRRREAEKSFEFARAGIYAYDAARHGALAEFGREVLDFASDLEKEEALSEMRMAALGGLTDAEYEEKVANVEEASDDDGLMDGVDLLRFLRSVQ